MRYENNLLNEIFCKYTHFSLRMLCRSEFLQHIVFHIQRFVYKTYKGNIKIKARKKVYQMFIFIGSLTLHNKYMDL